MPVTFEEWWSTDGCRMYAESHEARARQAWEAAQEEQSMQRMVYHYCELRERNHEIDLIMADAIIRLGK